jgi:hypothetical protein
MKQYIIFIALLLAGPLAFAQQAKKDSILRAVVAYRDIVFKDAAIFLNSNLGNAERINAIQKHPLVYDERQRALFKNIVLNEKEDPSLRATALNKIYGEVESDNKFFDETVKWFANPETPKVLREETLNLMGNLSISKVPGILDVYHKMTNDPSQPFREFAFAKLVVNGDARAQQLLINGLENPSSKLLDAIPAMNILSLAPKKDFYPAVLKLLQSTQNTDERLVAIQIVEGYRQAKGTLTSIFLSPQEESRIREAALVSFYSSNKAEAVNFVPQILQDKSASDNLRIMAIQVAINERKKMSYRKKARGADNTDRQIKAIADNKENNNKELVNVAQKYVLLVRPKY